MSFKKLESEDFAFGVDSVVAPAWITNTSSLKDFYGSNYESSITTTLSSPREYYMSVYAYNNDLLMQPSPNSIQFSIAYGDSEGSGSVWYSPATPNVSPTKTVYNQFINLLTGGEDENAFFDFGLNFRNTSIFALVINRSCYKQSILPGSLQIRGPYPDNVFITDNSRITSVVEYTPAGRRYILGSGSFGDGQIPPDFPIYGYLYPDVGIIILNAYAFDIAKIGNPNPIFRRGNNSNSFNPNRLRIYLESINLLSEETIPSNYIFCRARNSEFNYSLNPTFENSFYSSSLNEYILTPATYITSVGLYNDNNELLAVAKLSKPLKKEFDTEALIRVKLDF